jgi:hypothetical protein
MLLVLFPATTRKSGGDLDYLVFSKESNDDNARENILLTL